MKLVLEHGNLFEVLNTEDPIEDIMRDTVLTYSFKEACRKRRVLLGMPPINS